MEELDDEEYKRSKFDGSESKLSWIWGTGLYLGKKTVVTGVVISTAPFVLPPLVALSAIGFALSLPAGIVLATYACTDKLMNTLLPMPSLPYLEPVISSDDEDFEEDTRSTIPIILEGIREAENEISVMEREGVLTPDDSLLAVVVEAEVGEENEDSVEQVTEVLAFVPQKDVSKENWHSGEDFASDSGSIGIGVSTDYLEIQIKSTSISKQTDIGMDQEVTSRYDKVLINEEKIWEQIKAMRTIIGCKTAPHTSCVEELEVLYEFTGVDLPVSSKNGTDLGDVNEKLHFLKSIVGVK